MQMFNLMQGNCRERMQELPAESVHAIVTDPPYGLSNHKTKSVVACLESWITGNTYDTQNQKGFMNKEWDAWVPGPDVWREALRVLKPGGHLLAFAGTRSMDLMSLAIRLAGFELRDSIGWAHDSGQAPLLAWVYGSGFPKSRDVGRKIDQDAGAEREVVGTKKSGMGTGKTFGMLQAEGNNEDACPDIPGAPIPVTEEARHWDGWGTGLKPAWEPIIIARKPLAGSVTETVLAHGTGALNINECRISMGKEKTVRAYSLKAPGGVVGKDLTIWAKLSKEEYNARQEEAYKKQESMGRWPANVVIDDSEAVQALFPITSQRAGSVVQNNRKGPYSSDRTWNPSRTSNQVSLGYADTGSAARFFYCAKASKADRDAGVDGEPRVAGGMQDRADGSMGSITLRKNHHPTVKPTELMRYLCRLVTPPGGVVLDPFMGSGSTGKAAILEGFRFIGIDLNPEYIKIAKARIQHVATRGRGNNDEQEKLF